VSGDSDGLFLHEGEKDNGPRPPLSPGFGTAFEGTAAFGGGNGTLLEPL
jgi:hypothetical protein